MVVVKRHPRAKAFLEEWWHSALWPCELPSADAPPPTTQANLTEPTPAVSAQPLPASAPSNGTELWQYDQTAIDLFTKLPPRFDVNLPQGYGHCGFRIKHIGEQKMLALLANTPKYSKHVVVVQQRAVYHELRVNHSLWKPRHRTKCLFLSPEHNCYFSHYYASFKVLDGSALMVRTHVGDFVKGFLYALCDIPVAADLRSVFNRAAMSNDEWMRHFGVPDKTPFDKSYGSVETDLLVRLHTFHRSSTSVSSSSTSTTTTPPP